MIPCNASVLPAPVFNAAEVRYFLRTESPIELVDPKMFDSVLENPPRTNDFNAAACKSPCIATNSFSFSAMRASVDAISTAKSSWVFTASA